MGKLAGQVVSVSESGDLLTDISDEQLRGVPRDEAAVVACDGHETRGIFDDNHNEPDLTLIAMINQTGQMQLTLVGESAQAFFGIQVGQEVTVRW
ncbi:MAG: adenosylmethionine-8-amino-7-oxononanoate aminotransferase [Planctomycetota bacterium]